MSPAACWSAEGAQNFGVFFVISIWDFRPIDDPDSKYISIGFILTAFAGFLVFGNVSNQPWSAYSAFTVLGLIGLVDEYKVGVGEDAC